MLENIPTFTISFIAFCIGAIFGSFATALIYRLPRDINWVSKRSSCVTCERNLSFFDLVPLLSYIFFRGKCRKCKAVIGFRYFVVEIIMAVGFTLIIHNFGVTIDAAVICLLFFAIVILSAIDFEHYIIPDGLNIFIFLIGVFYAIYKEFDIISSLLNSAIYFFLAYSIRYGFYLWRKKEGLGLGDVKFFAAVGVFMNFSQIPIFLFIAGSLGVVTSLLWRLCGKGDIFPFGPALAMSFFLCFVITDLHQRFYVIIQQLLS